jgi:YihY family inner membrane protein
VSFAARVDEVQRERAWLSLPIAVVKRFSEHEGGRLSAAIAFYGFFSLFPLLLVFVSVLDIVLESRPEIREDLIDSALGQLPLIGTQISAPSSSVGEDVLPVLVGLGLALWAGLGVTAALTSAFATVWDARPSARPNAVSARLLGLGAVLVIGLLVAAFTVAGNVAGFFGVGLVASVVGLALNLAVNLLGLLVVFFVLTPSSHPWRRHVPGAVGGAAALLVLQQFGSAIARRYVENSSDTYGTLAVVIGLLVWIHLVTRTVVVSAELNAVLAHRLHPRSLADDVVSDADRRAMLLNTERVLHDEQLSPVVTVPENETVDW